jgi:anthranilate synthase/aminodeoxychorismate synthase-like glutamine amidotransferase
MTDELLPPIRKRILVVDNYDSFTFNLVQYLGELGAQVEVHRNDEIDVASIGRQLPDGILLSPGPCAPDQAGITLEVLQKLSGQRPILGVCLGHQAIGQAFGGKVVRNERVVHGKASLVHHGGKGLYAEIPSPFLAGRYHSLVVEKRSLPQTLLVTSWTEEGEIMGLRHWKLDVEGVQFHPESILTEHGKTLLANWLRRCGTLEAAHTPADAGAEPPRKPPAPRLLKRSSRGAQ